MRNLMEPCDADLAALGGVEIGEDLDIMHVSRRQAGGAWVLGCLNGHRFDALVFPLHCVGLGFELAESKISKLQVQRLVDHVTVANFDRGWDVQPVDDAAWAVVDFLCAGLSDHVFCGLLAGGE